MVNRQTKRKQSKRLQTKKRNYRKKTNKRQGKQKTVKTQKRKTTRGGNFNDEEIAKLLPILEEKGFKPEEIPARMSQLHAASQVFAGNNLLQLTSQIDTMNKEEFINWLDDVYPLYVDDVETDYESGNDY